MGTHPIFESDFDCLTEITKKEKKIMGEVRKRKNSGEAKNGTSAAPAAAPAKSGGLGLIPVVLISALLAGSGCHVIRKDTAKSIADLSDFVGELKAKNVETGQLVEKLRNTVATKDALVESLKAAINKNEKQAEQTDLKMEEIEDKLSETESASADRAKKITDLEQQLSTSHADAASKLDALNAVIDTLPQEIQKDLAKQGGEIESVSSKLAQLEAKVTEVLAGLESSVLEAPVDGENEHE